MWHGWLHAVVCSQGCDLVLSGIQNFFFFFFFLMCRDAEFSGGGRVAPMAFAQIVKRLTGERK